MAGRGVHFALNASERRRHQASSVDGLPGSFARAAAAERDVLFTVDP